MPDKTLDELKELALDVVLKGTQGGDGSVVVARSSANRGRCELTPQIMITGHA